MEYDCRTIPVAKTIVGSGGLVEPLCNSCKSVDCSNRIQFSTVSVMGALKKWRLLVKAGSIAAVIDCEGYTR